MWVLLGCVGSEVEPGKEITKDTGTATDGCEGPEGYVDADGDGYGADAADPCGEEIAVVPLAGDCDDADPAVFPDAPELCDRVERDCDAEQVAAAQIGPQGYATLAQALEGAVEGDVIEVCEGTLREHDLVVDESVTIASFTGLRDSTVLDGQGLGPVLVVNGASALTLRSLTLRSGRSAGSGGAVDGLGAAVTVEDCVLEGNQAGESGGAVRGQEVVLLASLLRGNQAQGRGGAAHAEGTLEATGCTFEDNQAMGQGGALEASGEALHVAGSIFQRNESALAGGALHGANLEILDSSFADNRGSSAGVTGGALSVSDGTLTVAGSTFEANTASAGGAFYSASAGSVSVSDSSFTGNVATDGAAGYLAGGGTLDLQGVSFTANRADLTGGALVVYDGVSTADEATVFESNEVVSGDLGSGGGLFLSSSSSSTRWTGGTFLWNRAGQLGGGVYAISTAPGTTLSGLLAEGNRSDLSGGGVYLVGPGLALTDSVVADNQTTVAGGGTSVNSTGQTESRLERVELRGNEATGYLGGGAADVYQANLRLVDCIVEGNQAAGLGGGMYVDSESRMMVESTDFDANVDDDIYMSGASTPSYAELGADVTLTCTPAQGCL